MAFIRVINLCACFTRARALGVLILFLAVLMVATAPQKAFSQQTSSPPDVIVLIISGASAYDAVSVTYNGVMDQSAVNSDLAAIQKAAGWSVTDVKTTTEGNPKTTSLEFATTGIADWKSGVIQIEPFIVALKRYNSIRISYVLSGTFPFRSLQNYSNRYVDIIYSGTDTSAEYTVKIKNHDFEQLKLPLVVEPKADKQKSEGNEAGGKNIWLALLLAVMAGAIVFAIVNRISRK